ncbi:MAG: hypothetical protein H7Y22_15065 [Gemmatimonadaceae bacterium]|nr:hypothetical protein [Gloeobacterales cyanobacterium ES-bin-141]
MQSACTTERTDKEALRGQLHQSGLPVFMTTVRRSVGFARAALEGVADRTGNATENSASRL